MLTANQMSNMRNEPELVWLRFEASKNRAVHQDTIKDKISAAINRCFPGRVTDDNIRQVAQAVGTPWGDVVQAQVAEDYSEVIGTYGRVPEGVVEDICVQYKMKRDVVLQACHNLAPPQGRNGVKPIHHRTYSHELKLIPMGDERVYAKSMMGGVPVFAIVAKHL
jgi:hypothetical protein